MKNTAEITNDGACIYLDSTVKPDATAKVTLMLLNLFSLMLFGVIAYATWKTNTPRGLLFAIYVLLPVIYCMSVGRLTLWNLFGKEYVIINTKSLSFKRHYGILTGKLKVLPYKGLHYTIKETEKHSGIAYGIINFAQHDLRGQSVNLFTTSITLPVKQLNHLIEQLTFLFTLEQISDPEYEIIHLN